ncbi:MAG: MATE family efflux transporter [Lachnospiraceae bacterium]|nr:MATE family efflux transporter [Lachnospiraceae bacterium]
MFSNRDLLKMILPSIIQQVLAITVSTADSIMVASAGEAAVSGVSLVGTLDSLLIIAFSSLVSGGAVIVSHTLGNRNEKLARECAKQLIYVATGIALFLTIVMSIFCMPMLSLLYGNAEQDVLFNANSYLRIMVLSFPFLALYNSCEALFRVMGNTMISMILSFIMNAINIAGNALFIFGFEMGTAGAALATLISRILCSVIMILLLHNRKNDVYIENLFSYRPDFNVIKKILHIGVPHGLESSMFQFGRLVTQVLISSMGTASIAANSVANTLANYLYMPSNAIQNCAVTVVGRCVGAGEKNRQKNIPKPYCCGPMYPCGQFRFCCLYWQALSSVYTIYQKRELCLLCS